jgi:hypothetical protein
MRGIRNVGKGRGGLGLNNSGVRVEVALPLVQKKRRGKHYDINHNY